ncbi:type I restriction enzyme, R subunit [Cognatiyoonia koreensis]|uniref:Type I restriction enzyme, R subunit n=1 Tax=Cognatiyoonia koreensis TaxID=364200 RepID=A0A1I0QYG5_9RHOB|nr:type I restriction endonuclease subunit R [Cognatiyoonia koreensis]SEW32914.1 type I restriction enzyme, R subunit [Cognatiyoonia koreensis]
MIDESPLSRETEADTRAMRIDPDLAANGWEGPAKIDGARVHREEMLWPGRIMSGGQTNGPKPADYVLRMNGHVMAVMEAKKASLPYTDGRSQAYDYANRIGARFAYCTNGLRYHEIDMHTGAEQEVDAVPPPSELWDRCYPTGNAWRDRFGQVPFETDGGKWQPRYYQAGAVNAVLEAMADGEKRILLTLATGTGKTSIAFQIAWKLFQSRWSLSGEPTRRPRILFLADRNILADQAYNSFSAFEPDALSRINPKEISKKGKMPRNASVFFTIFQTFMTENKNGEEEFNFREYEEDFFDFIIIDECHRGGAKDESTWRKILEYFEPAVQLGLTATPKRKVNADTYSYFGEPVYTYALRDGIEDGFLTPFKVRQMASTIDTYVYDPDDEVVGGEIDPDHVYTEAEINAKIVIPEREQSRIHEFMDQINPRQKTLVFCATQNHAAAVRDYINQIKDIDDPHYCERVTANDGALGEQHLREFQDNERSIPTILTTSQKLSTGVDARNVRNIVLMRPVKSMIEFKQIVGRGTRTFEGKDFFTVFDFVKAYEHFNDPEWDGEPLPPDVPNPRPAPAGGSRPEGPPDPSPEPEAKIIVKLADGKERQIKYVATTTYFSHDGKMISGQEFMDQLFGDLGDLVRDEDHLREIWSNPETRVQFFKVLADRGYDSDRLEDMKLLIDAPNSDVFDVLAYVRFTLQPLERSERVSKAKDVGLSEIEGEMRSFLEAVLNAYEIHGVDELALTKITDFLRVRYGGTNGAKHALGGIPQIKQAFTEIQAHLYAD